MITVENLGKIFKDGNGAYWRLISYCEQPSAIFQKIGSSERMDGAACSRVFAEFEIAGPIETKIIDTVLDQLTKDIEELEANCGALK